MIEKMKFLSITGPKDDIDRVVNTYLFKYDFHLENALTELKTVGNLKPFIETNPYKETLGKAHKLLAGIKCKRTGEIDFTAEKAANIIETIDKTVCGITDEKERLVKKRQKINSSLEMIMPLRDLNYNIDKILEFKYIKFRFGRIAKENFEKFEKTAYNNIDTFFVKSHEDAEYISGVYFMPAALASKIDAIYASMHFERVFLPNEYEGKPEEVLSNLKKEILELDNEILLLDKNLQDTLEENKEELLSACNILQIFSDNFDIRQLAALTNDKLDVFYILCGWMIETDAKNFIKEVEEDENLFCMVEDDHDNVTSRPPTKLKNMALFRPFEMYIKMYGLPSYGEVDPTMLVALTYSILFGFMFGDVGQGFCLTVGGFLIYKFKKADIGGIISCAGIFSMFFGVMFGSVFGFEHVVNAVWLHPNTHMTNLPFIGNINTVFVTAVAVGTGIIVFTMLLQIRNAIKDKNIERLFFESNGIAGLILYVSLAVTVILFLTGNKVPSGIILGIAFGLPLTLIALKEPLTAVVEKKAEIMPKEKGMFIMQTFFELFELLLSYFSNTLSFVRVGAFAVSHAAMMGVVLMLAGVENGGNTNIWVIILGNLFVMGMEGLIVGIQVLRLEYYEIFSRFYKSGGREFKPYAK
jgi:Archaeal/vacuolar-type H+-ATPase subunit I